jgi:hypothetical protein
MGKTVLDFGQLSGKKIVLNINDGVIETGSYFLFLNTQSNQNVTLPIILQR